jgi:DNA invertase Pin-like site-specific DNA recombinase
MRIGYARVSTTTQTYDPQGDRLGSADCERIYSDVYTGSAASRPEWDKCLTALRAGDVLVVVRLDRIGRSVRNLIAVVNDIQARGVDLLVLDQAIDTTTPAGKLMFHVLAAIAEFEKDIIRERTMDGLATARARGHNGGRKPKLSSAQRRTVTRMYAASDERGRRLHTVQEIAETVGVHRTTVYAYLRQS